MSTRGERVLLWPGNDSINTAADHKKVLADVAAQLPGRSQRAGRSDASGGADKFLGYLTAPAPGVLDRFRYDRDHR